MNTAIMIDWLKAFYRHVGNRTVLLAMDNFSAHYTGLEACPPPANVRICWLPRNSTSRFRRLDQGIIQNITAYYRRYWLQYMVERLEKRANPTQAMNVHLALRWVFRSWYTNVSVRLSATVFVNQALLRLRLPFQHQFSPLILRSFTNKTQQRPISIHDAMSLGQSLLNPPEEVVEDIVDENGQADCQGAHHATTLSPPSPHTDDELFQEILE